jgi:hypothetical protein
MDVPQLRESQRRRPPHSVTEEVWTTGVLVEPETQAGGIPEQVVGLSPRVADVHGVGDDGGGGDRHAVALVCRVRGCQRRDGSGAVHRGGEQQLLGAADVEGERADGSGHQEARPGVGGRLLLARAHPVLLPVRVGVPDRIVGEV